MRHELTVTAYNAATGYDTKENLISTIELRIPPEELEFMREALRAEEDDKDVRSTLVIRSKADGEPRKLSLTLKNSKMKNFVPVAIFTKYGHAHDNLTQLFDTGWYGGHELLLIMEIIEERQQEELDFDAEPVTPTWVLDQLRADDLALERMLDEGCPHCPDAHDPEYLGALRHIDLCTADELCELLEHVGFDPTSWDDPKRTQAQDMAEWRLLLAARWQDLNLTVVMSGGEG